jgi:hypothetical protein
MLPTQHIINTREEHPYPHRDSNPRCQQSTGCRPTIRPHGHGDRQQHLITTFIFLISNKSVNWEFSLKWLILFVSKFKGIFKCLMNLPSGNTLWMYDSYNIFFVVSANFEHTSDGFHCRLSIQAGVMYFEPYIYCCFQAVNSFKSAVFHMLLPALKQHLEGQKSWRCLEGQNAGFYGSGTQ